MIYPYSIKRTTDSSSEPITLAEAKEHLRVDHSTDDTYIQTLIKVARQSVEISTGRSLASGQTYVAGYQFFPYMYDRLVIPRPPFSTVSSVKYHDAEDTEQTLSASSYVVDSSGSGCALLSMTDNFDYPTLTKNREARVLVTFTAGDTPPEPLYQAMLLLITHYYDTREPVAYNANPMKVPRSVDFLCRQYKVRSS